MKSYRYFLLCFAMVPNTTLATARSTSTGQSISVEISMSDTAPKGGCPIAVTAAMTNVSGHDLNYVITNASPLFEITVTNLAGELAPETEIGRHRHSWLSGHEYKPSSIFSTRQVLGPQKSIKVVEDICKEYDIRKPGRYSVRVEVQDPEHPGNKVKSNAIVFILTSP